MSKLGVLDQEQGFLKAGLLGFAGSGKTHTAVDLAIYARRFFGLDGPIAFFDTENGTSYVARWIERETGRKLVGLRSRSFVDLIAMSNECVTAGVSVLIVDSITHPWRELCDSYLAQVNRAREARRLSPRSGLALPDWAPIKAMWKAWPDFYINSPLHIIMNGRAGFEWGEKQSEDDPEKSTLAKTGIKMKTETETGFEPSLLIEMQRSMDPITHAAQRVALVLKDRFRSMDGREIVNPKGADFLPHLEQLKAGGSHITVVEPQTDFRVSEDGDAGWYVEKRQRAILSEEITAEFVKHMPGAKAEDKAAKVALLEACFGTSSWTAIENMRSEKLKDGLAVLRTRLMASNGTGATAPADAFGRTDDAPVTGVQRWAEGMLTVAINQIEQTEKPETTKSRKARAQKGA